MGATVKAVTYTDSADWGCERTEADVTRWHARIERRLSEMFPGAEVEVVNGDRSELEVDGRVLSGEHTVISNDEWEAFCAANWDAP